jgi:hypothetical protein
VKINLLHTDAFITHGLDARNVVHQGSELPLVQSQYSILDVLRAHPVVRPNDRNYRDVYFREDIDGHAQSCADSHQGSQNENGDNRIRPFQCQIDDRHFPRACSGERDGSIPHMLGMNARRISCRRS